MPRDRTACCGACANGCIKNCIGSVRLATETIAGLFETSEPVPSRSRLLSESRRNQCMRQPSLWEYGLRACESKRKRTFQERRESVCEKVEGKL